MHNDAPHPIRPADAVRGSWVDRVAPRWLVPYARLARWDRPIGFWLLFWPCALSLSLHAAGSGTGMDWRALILCLAGAIAMRGAGCTFNDIIDAEIDLKVARTRGRPIPAGMVSRKQAVLFLVLQALAGLVVLLQFNGFTIGLGVASLVLVAIYPFMKRVTWWPQLFLGLAFSWGALMGFAIRTGGLPLPSLLLYFGAILWTIGYDTIYALQDREDDALIGVKSTALLFGQHAREFVALFYIAAVATWGTALVFGGTGPFGLGGLAAVAVLLAWQVVTLKPADGANALVRFKSNHYAGLVLSLGLLLDSVLRTA